MMLLRFLLDKRNINMGGVDYYSSPIEFPLEELKKKHSIIDESCLCGMLSGLQNEHVYIYVKRYDRIISETLFDSFKIENNVVTVFNCTTEKLDIYYDFIKKQYKKDFFFVNEENRTVTDNEGHTHTFRKGKYKNRWFLFYYLYGESDGNGGIAKTYEEIFRQLYSGTKKNDRYTDSDKEYVWDLANGLNKDLHEKGFPKMIKNEKNYGYKLDVFNEG
jgi:hypothetical protein